MTTAGIHVGDVGTVIEVTVKDESTQVFDLSSQTKIRLDFKSPRGVVRSHDATLVSDGSDGRIAYTTRAGDFDEVGIWSVQAYIELANGDSKHSDLLQFQVYPNVA